MTENTALLPTRVELYSDLTTDTMSIFPGPLGEERTFFVSVFADSMPSAFQTVL